MIVIVRYHCASFPDTVLPQMCPHLGRVYLARHGAHRTVVPFAHLAQEEN